MATQEQIDKALKAGYTMEQINIEQATPGTVKRNAALGNPVYEQPVNGQYASAGTTPPRTPDVGQISTGVNAGGETLYNFGAQTPQAPTVPTTPTVQQPVPGSASSIFGPENTFENQYYKNLNDQYNTPIDEEAIRRQKQADYQAQLDSVKAIYADQLNQARVRGQGRQGSSSAIQARRGLLGSNVGEAMTNNIETLNVQEQDLVRQEEANAIAAIQGLIRSGANEEIAAKKLAIKEGGEKLLAYYSGAGDRKAKKTTDAAKKLLALGKDPTAISDADLATAGIDKNDLLAEFNTLSDAKIAADDKLAREEERRQLENIKLGAEGDKIAADINRQNAELLLKQIETGKAYVAGGFIFDGATNEVIGNAQAVKKAAGGGGGGGGGGGTYTINGQTYNSQLYSGLKSPTATAVRGQVGAFKSEPIVTNFNQIQEGYLLTKSLDNKTKNPTDDQALIYSLAKTLDPGSVVREGEYATVQKYAQSWVDAYGKGVEQAVNGTGFLSEQARKNIKATIESKYNTSKKTYDNLSNQYIKGINDLTGRQDGDKFIRDYTVEQSDAPQTGGGTGTGNSNNPLGI